MRTWTKHVVALAAVALMGSWSAGPASAVENLAASTGSIKGTVMKDGKPAGNVQVRLIKAADAQERKNAAGKLAEGEKPRPPKPSGDKPAGDKPAGDKPEGGRPPQGERPQRPTPVAEATTDAATGAFVLENVAPGEYVVQAGDRASGFGGREKVTVTAGGTATVTVNLKERKAPPKA